MTRSLQSAQAESTMMMKKVKRKKIVKLNAKHKACSPTRPLGPRAAQEYATVHASRVPYYT